jgi:GMP synthase (glutamine-hydrolysing)
MFRGKVYPFPNARRKCYISSLVRSLKILLLQARHRGDPALVEEIRAFAAACGLGEDRFVPHDLLAGPPTVERIRVHDALMVGGSGEFYVSRADLPGFEALLAVLAEVAETGHPTFASCFGFQLLVRALGGGIVHDPDHMETGTYVLELTEDGRRDPLFGGLPRRFRAQLGRKDRASHLPEGAVHLAASRRSPFQALRLPGKPVWATQFHPELTREANLKRFLRYLDGYTAHLSDEERQQAFERYDESPETHELLRRFLRLVFG